MPLRPEVQAIVDELADLYAAAQANLVDELIRAGADLSGTSAAYRRRLTGLARAVDEEMVALQSASRTWAASRLPEVYQLGAATAAREAGKRFHWTMIHRDAVQELAGMAFDDLLAATRHVRRDTKAFVRVATRERARATLLEGKTARQGGRDLARHLEDRGVTAVTYRNGARHAIGEYGAMAVRTTSALAYNNGTLNAGREAGVRWYECFDGPSCGLSSHDDSELANGLVAPAEVAFANPLAHPNCSRSWAARPDIGSKVEADAARRDPADGGVDTVYGSATATSSHSRRLDQRAARLEARAAKVTART